MKDLLFGLGLISCPALIFAAFGMTGLDAFDERTAAGASSAAIERGRIAFAEECAACHGRMADGTGRGPDLIRQEYGAEAFDDARILRVVSDGAPQRRWRYGAMPPVTSVAGPEVDAIVTFLRELQRAQGVR